MVVRILIAAAVGITVFFASGGLAVAKGPSSATVSGPGIDQPIELLDAAKLRNAEYGASLTRLMRQTGLWYASGGPNPAAVPPGKLGPAYTLTWVNSGPPGESVASRTITQRLYLDASGGPLIHTPEALEGWGPGTVGWFAADVSLRDTLTELGVPVQSSVPAASLGYLVALGIATVLIGGVGVWRMSGSS